MTLHFADAEELAKSGGKLLSARGHLMADKRTNRLLIRDDARHLPALKAWAQEMDLPVGQVELAAHIVSMSETSLRELGVKWRLAEAGSLVASGQITTLSSDVSVNDASTRAGFNIGKINGRLLELELIRAGAQAAGRNYCQPAFIGLPHAACQHQAGEARFLSGFQWRKRRHFGGVQRGGAGHGGHADGAAAGKSAA